jgi:hypothetical protein
MSFDYNLDLWYHLYQVNYSNSMLHARLILQNKTDICEAARTDMAHPYSLKTEMKTTVII